MGWRRWRGRSWRRSLDGLGLWSRDEDGGDKSMQVSDDSIRSEVMHS
jgi:hypothetical protein